MRKQSILIALLLLVLERSSPAPSLPSPERFSFDELLGGADVVLIVEVVTTGEVGRQSEGSFHWIVNSTVFKVLAKVKGAYPNQTWTLSHRSVDWSKYKGGTGNPPHDVVFSDKFHDAYVAFLRRSGDRLEPVTGDTNIAPSFRMIENLRPRLVDVQAGPVGSLTIGGTNVPLDAAASYLDEIGAGQYGRGINVLFNRQDPQNSNAWQIVWEFAGTRLCPLSFPASLSVQEKNDGRQPQQGAAELPLPSPPTGHAEGAR